MSRWLTPEERHKRFIEKVRKVHGDKYDLSRVAYRDARKKVTVVCPEHGPFDIRPDALLRGSGCKKCAIAATAKKNAVTFDEFVRRARRTHGDKYDYDRASFVSISRNKVRIRCRKHGWFEQEGLFHVLGNGCPKCAHDKKRRGQEDIIRQFIAVHGDRYGYEQFVYSGYHEKGVVLCRVHGPYRITPADHIAGKGCRKCGVERASANRRRPLQFVEARIREIYGDTFCIIPETYRGTNDYADFVCKFHGRKNRIWVAHVLSGHGCRECGSKKLASARLLDKHEVARRLLAILPDGVHFDVVSFSGIKEDMRFLCEGCGVVRYKPDYIFNRGFVCNCDRGPNKFERSVTDFIESLGIRTEAHVRGILGAPCTKAHELDVYIPDRNVAIECHGAVWHSDMFARDAEKQHWKKAQAAKNAGIRLIQIFDYEWNDPVCRLILQDIMARALGVRMKRVGARELDLHVGKATDKLRHFLRRNHLRGPSGTTYAWLERDGEIYAAMGLDMRQSVPFVSRYAIKLGMHVPGAFNRLFKALVKELCLTEVRFYVDDRLFSGAGVMRAGFQLDGHVPPRYVYVKGNGVYAGDRRSFQRKKILKAYPDMPPHLTEREMTKRLGLYRLYDAGKTRYVWRAS